MSGNSNIVLDTFAAMDDDEKEACIHCGKVWYRIHHRDGVCHECQALGRPGRNALRASKQLGHEIAFISLTLAIGGAIAIMIMCLVF